MYKNVRFVLRDPNQCLRSNVSLFIVAPTEICELFIETIITVTRVSGRKYYYAL